MTSDINYVKHFISIDLITKDITIKQTGGFINVQEQNYGHRLYIKLFEARKEYVLPPLEDAIIQFVYKKPDGSKSDCNASIQDNTIVVDVPVVAVNEKGSVCCEVRIITSFGTLISTPSFEIWVGESLYNRDEMQELVDTPTIYEQMLASEVTRQQNEEQRIASEIERDLKIDSIKRILDSLCDGEDFTGIMNYNNLQNMPSINGVTVQGDKNLEDYNLDQTLDEVGNAEILLMIGRIFN